MTCQKTNLPQKHNFLRGAVMPGPDEEPSAIIPLLHLAHFWTRRSYKRVQPATRRVSQTMRSRERELGRGEGEVGGPIPCSKVL